MKTKKFTKTEINNAEKVIREKFGIWKNISIERLDYQSYTDIYIYDDECISGCIIERASAIVNAYKVLGYELHYTIEIKDNKPTIDICFWKK